jgi:hypothetical protein
MFTIMPGPIGNPMKAGAYVDPGSHGDGAGQQVDEQPQSVATGIHDRGYLTTKYWS